jgi:heat shock protein HslJ
MKTSVKILYIFILLGLFGCSKDKSSNLDLTSSKWFFQGIRYSDSNTEELIPDNLKGMDVTFNTLNKLHAKSSCNVFDGDYTTAESNSIKIDNLATTKIYCIDDNTRSWESIYYECFKNSTSFEFSADTLFILTSSGVTMIFKKDK